MSYINHKVGCTLNGVHLYYGWFEAMHTRMDIMLVGVEELRGSELIAGLYGDVKRLESVLNRFDPESALAKINNRARVDGYREGVTSSTDSELIEIFADAERYKQLTEGLFDIAIQSAGFRAGQILYSTDLHANTITFTELDSIFDFGGYAKGYALDKMRKRLVNAGVESALLSFGNSSVSAIGHHPAGKSWQVCVDNPVDKSTPLTTIELMESAMSTSGNTPHNKGHIKSATNGKSVTDQKLITVSSPSALDCEVLSTALFTTSDPEQRQRIIARFESASFVELHY